MKKRMTKISSKEFLHFLNTFNFRVWQKQGSHITVIQDNTQRQLTFPNRKQLGRFTIERSLENAGISLEEFYAEFDKDKGKI